MMRDENCSQNVYGVKANAITKLHNMPSSCGDFVDTYH